MKLRRLGDSDLEVSEISLGSWLTYSGGVGARPDRGVHRRPPSTPASTSSTPPTSTAAGAAEEAWGEILSGYAARLLRARDQGLLPDVGDRPRALGGADPQADRRLARPACRPTTSTSTSATASTLGPPIEETMEALTEVVERRQGALHRLQRMDAGADPRRPRRAGRGEVRLLPAAVLHDLARARGRGLPALRGNTASRRSSGRRSPRAC